jgi:hypothetical protein
LSAVLFSQIAATICICLSIAFFFSLLIRELFEEVDTVVYALIYGGLELKPEPKGLIHYYVYANVANRIVLSFV